MTSWSADVFFGKPFGVTTGVVSVEWGVLVWPDALGELLRDSAYRPRATTRAASTKAAITP